MYFLVRLQLSSSDVLRRRGQRCVLACDLDQAQGDA